MSSKVAKTVTKILLNSTSHIRTLLAHAARLEALTVLVCNALPAPLNQHCRVANVRDDVLVLHADSAVWASKLHYQLPILQFRLAETGPSFQIQIKVRPFSNTLDQPPAAKTTRLPKERAALVAALADDNSSPELQAALQCLANESKKLT